jgi:protein CMS1
MTFDDNLQEPFLEDSLEGSPGPSPSLSSEAKPQKRKRDSEIETDEAIVKIPKQKKKKKTSKVLEEDEFDLSIGINKAFSNMDSQLLADYMAQRTKKYESELSSIELEDRYISGKCNKLDSSCRLLNLL